MNNFLVVKSPRNNINFINKICLENSKIFNVSRVINSFDSDVEFSKFDFILVDNDFKNFVSEEITTLRNFKFYDAHKSYNDFILLFFEIYRILHMQNKII